MKAETIILILVLSGGASITQLEGEELESDWLRSKRSEIKKIESLERSERIEGLSGFLRAMGRYEKTMNADQKSIYDFTQKELLETPGIDVFFEEKLETIKTTLRGQGGDVDYDRARVRSFETMRHLPHPGIVRVLGETLEDDEDQPRMPVEGENYDAVGNVANSSMAAMALGRMIEKPPVKRDPMLYFDHDIEVWKLWYAQVKGDSKVHYLAKSQEPRPPAAEREAPSSPPVRERERAPVVKPATPTDRPFPWIPTVIASSLLLLSAGWLAASRRKMKSGN